MVTEYPDHALECRALLRFSAGEILGHPWWIWRRRCFTLSGLSRKPVYARARLARSSPSGETCVVCPVVPENSHHSQSIRQPFIMMV